MSEQVDARLRRVDPVEQGVEVESLAGDDDDLPVNDDALGKLTAERVDELREVAGHRPFVSAADLHLVAVANTIARKPSHFAS